jgi:protein SCO1/2
MMLALVAVSARALPSMAAAIESGTANREGTSAGLVTQAAPTPAELVGAEIVDKLGAKVPTDIALVDDAGASVTLAKYMGEAGGRKPVLLTLGYYECPMLCTLVLNATLDALKEVDLVAGRDFQVVSVSINPKDTTALAAAKRATHLKALHEAQPKVDVNGDAWRFHTTTEGEVKRLADAVGFGYRYDPITKNWAHGAGIFFLSPDGVLTRTLWGLTYSPLDVRLALIDASQGRVGTVIDRILLTCFQYSTVEHKYSVYVFGFLRIGALLTLLGVGGALFAFWRKEQRAARADDGAR